MHNKCGILIVKIRLSLIQCRYLFKKQKPVEKHRANVRPATDTKEGKRKEEKNAEMMMIIRNIDSYNKNIRTNEILTIFNTEKNLKKKTNTRVYI